MAKNARVSNTRDKHDDVFYPKTRQGFSHYDADIGAALDTIFDKCEQVCFPGGVS